MPAARSTSQPAAPLRQMTFGERLESLTRRMEARDARGPAAGILGCVLALLGIGLLIQASHASTTVPAEHFADELRGLLVYRIAGLGVLLVAMRIGPRRLAPLVPALTALAILSLLAVYIPGVGVAVNGARRWLQVPGVGITIQPSELACVVLVLWVARRCVQLGDRVRDVRQGFLPMLVFSLVLSGLILFEPDLGGSMLFLCCLLATMWVGGARPSHLAGSLGVIGGGVLVLLMTWLAHARERIAIWMGESVNPQVERSLSAMSSGDLVGVGLAQGGWRNAGLPYHQTDYVLTMIGEELGFLGVALVLAILVAYAWQSLRMVVSIRDRYCALAAFGLLISVALQAMLHAQVATGLAPPKGMNLPLVSDGGSSLLATCLAVGLALGAAQPQESDQDDPLTSA